MPSIETLSWGLRLAIHHPQLACGCELAGRSANRPSHQLTGHHGVCGRWQGCGQKIACASMRALCAKKIHHAWPSCHELILLCGRRQARAHVGASWEPARRPCPSNPCLELGHVHEVPGSHWRAYLTGVRVWHELARGSCPLSSCPAAYGWGPASMLLQPVGGPMLGYASPGSHHHGWACSWTAGHVAAWLAGWPSAGVPWLAGPWHRPVAFSPKALHVPLPV